jgi:flagellar protein FliO/FliZ
MIDFWDSIIRTASALALVLALIGGLVVLVRRFAGTRFCGPVSTQIVHVLGSGYIGPRKSISLVSVAGEFLIVGMTPTDLVPLGHITDRERVQQFLSAATSGRSVLPGRPTAHNDLQAPVRDGKAETGGSHVG